MKFKIGDKVRKLKGYKFEGVVISGGYKIDQERILYSVEVEKHRLEKVVCTNCLVEDFKVFEQNCGGMVHIFAEGDLELI